MEEKQFQVLNVTNIPEVSNNNPFSGIRVVKFNSWDVLVAWQGSYVFLSKISAKIEANICFEVCRVECELQDVFSIGTGLYCFSTEGTLFKLEKRKSERRLSSSDIFQSSSDCDSGTEDQQSYFKNYLFKALLDQKNSLAIHPVRDGCVMVKENGTDIVLAVFKRSGEGALKGTCSIQICENTWESSTCILMSRPQSTLSPNLKRIFLEDIALRNVDLVFVAVGSGLVYCLPVTSEGQIACRPKLIYKTVDVVTGFVCLPEVDDSSGVMSYLGVVLSCGFAVLISYNMTKNTLAYIMVTLPGHVQTVCSVGDRILASDRVDLWSCQLKRDPEEGNLTLDQAQLRVKGAQWLAQRPGSTVIYVTTVHGTFYILDVTKPSPKQQSSHSWDPVLLSKQLEKLSTLKQELIREEELFTALSTVLRADIITESFPMTVRVSMKSLDEDETRSTLKHQYLLNVTLENTSDIEFPSSVWDAQVSVSTDQFSSCKSVKLGIPTFKEDVPFQTALSTAIDDQTWEMEVRCVFVCELSDEGTSPWLIFCMANTRVDISHFFIPSLTSCHRGGFTSCESLLRAVRQNNHGVSSLYQQKTAVEEHVYIVRIPNNMQGREVWSRVFQNCLHHCSRHILQLFEDHSIHDQTVYVAIGSSEVVLSLSNSQLTLKGKNLRMLHAVKCVVTSLISVGSPVSLSTNTITRALEIRDTFQVEKPLPSLQTVKSFWTEWRNFLSESVPL